MPRALRAESSLALRPARALFFFGFHAPVVVQNPTWVGAVGRRVGALDQRPVHEAPSHRALRLRDRFNADERRLDATKLSIEL